MCLNNNYKDIEIWITFNWPLWWGVLKWPTNIWENDVWMNLNKVCDGVEGMWLWLIALSRDDGNDYSDRLKGRKFLDQPRYYWLLKKGFCFIMNQFYIPRRNFTFWSHVPLVLLIGSFRDAWINWTALWDVPLHYNTARKRGAMLVCPNGKQGKRETAR